MRWLKKLGRFAVDYVDLLIALGLAIAFTYLGFVNKLKDDALTQATVGLLGVLALVIFRERWERHKSVESIDRAVAAVGSDKTWQVLDEELTWDIQSPELAISTCDRDLRFLAPEVISIYEFQTNPAGTVANYSCKGGRRGDPMRDLTMLPPVASADGRTYRLISLEGVWRRGERMKFRSTRELQGTFLQNQENVSKLVQIPTDRIVFRILWPEGKPPAMVRLERDGRESELLKPRIREKRTQLEKSIENPQLGERINVWWTW